VERVSLIHGSAFSLKRPWRVLPRITFTLSIGNIVL
jgi:hypothetical protein